LRGQRSDHVPRPHTHLAKATDAVKRPQLLHGLDDGRLALEQVGEGEDQVLAVLCAGVCLCVPGIDCAVRAPGGWELALARAKGQAATPRTLAFCVLNHLQHSTPAARGADRPAGWAGAHAQGVCRSSSLTHSKDRQNSLQHPQGWGQTQGWVR
jgi:hypothetical protein